MEAMTRTCQGDPPSFDSYPASERTPSADFRHWVALLLQKKPQKRPTVDQLLLHPFLTRESDEAMRSRLQAFLASIPDLQTETFSASDSSRSTPVSAQWHFS